MSKKSDTQKILDYISIRLDESTTKLERLFQQSRPFVAPEIYSNVYYTHQKISAVHSELVLLYTYVNNLIKANEKRSHR